MDWHLLEINLISAQGLKPPPGRGGVQGYAVAWIDPSAKLRTRVDRVGGENPTWNDRFLFRVPASFLADDSPSAVSVEIYASGGWLIPDLLIGTVRFLIGNERLLSRPLDSPSFAAVGIRRPSGRFHGVLNVGATLLGRHVSLLAEALAGSSAVAYHDLNCRRRRRTAQTPGPLRDVNRDLAASGRGRNEKAEEVEEMRSDGGVVFCGPCLLPFPRRIHLSPSDQNLQITMPEQNPRQ
ncbi:BON1-associated protein 2 [Typha latifolia]|uniref:BON1-associated protein 2 n=1 Tax=Typha latifolia TaxID=4733 RepID=UPI003C2F93B1